MTYDTLRHLADSWGLLFLFGVFVVAIAGTILPGASARLEKARQIPLNDEGPAR